MKNDDTILCPKCGSSQIHSDKRGFKVGRAVTGTVLTGGLAIGALAGGIGMNKIELTCLSCGVRFKIGEQGKAKDKKWEEKASELEKHVISKKEMGNFLLYLCDCGKKSSLLEERPICPRCGRRQKESNKVDVKEEIKSRRGCAFLFFIPIIAIISLFIYYAHPPT